MPDDDAPTPPAGSSWLSRTFSSSQSPAASDPELKERLRTLDDTERKWGFGAAAVTLAVGAIYVPFLLHDTTTTTTANPDKSGSCPTSYHLVGKVCEHTVTHHPSEFVLRFVLVAVFGLTLLGAVWFSKRVLVIVSSLFAGFAAGTVGLALFGYAIWLVVRSWRLQRYGATDGATVRRAATERAAAKRAAKKSGGTAAEASAKSPPPPSKRYTPKSKPRRK